MRITVIMSTYNVEEFIDECISSIVNQTYKNFVVKIIDDNSQDQTAEIIKKWSFLDNRIQLVTVNKDNKGLTKNLNRLINESETEYIARMDADDVMMPTRLERQLNFLDSNKDISVVGTWAYDINEFGDVLKKRTFPASNNEIKKKILKTNPVLHPSVLIRTKDLIELKGYDEQYRYVQDYDLWFRFLGYSKKIVNLPEQLMKYRVITNHVKKRNLSYRLIDAKIRWRGSKLLGHGFVVRVLTSSFPIILGLMPNSLKKFAMKFNHN